MTLPSSVMLGMICWCCPECGHGYRNYIISNITKMVENHINEHIDNIRELSKSNSSEISVTYQNIGYIDAFDEKISRYFNQTSAIRRLFTNYSIGDNICQKLSENIGGQLSFRIEVFNESINGYTKLGYTIIMIRL